MAPTFSFFRAGGFDQVQFNTGADLLAIGELDQKLWVALACPVKGLELDAQTLGYVDSDGDGRIRAPELIAAAKWVGTVLARPDSLLERRDGLSASEISTATDEGKLLGATVRTILERLDKPSDGRLTVELATAAKKTHDALPFNGDGVVPVASADDATKALAQEVIDCAGSAQDRSGAVGFNEELTTAFFAAVAEYAAWLKEASPKAMPLGDKTTAAYEAMVAVRAKIDDFFARASLAAFDDRALAAVNRDEKEFVTMSSQELSATSDSIAQLPIAKVAPQRALPLSTGLNPAWEAKVRAFATLAAKPLLGEIAVLTSVQWLEIKNQFAGYEAFQQTKRGASVEKLGAARVRELALPGARAKLDALLEKEKLEAPVGTSLAGVDRLVRYHRDLHKLITNFVNFREFYTRTGPATFQVGTLFIDQRSCSLCLRVDDVAKHAALALESNAYLAYCDVTHPSTKESMSIVAAVTAGDADNLAVGRNGLFYDRNGQDWDATITKLVPAPLSVRQAFVTPYKKLAKFIENQVSKRTASAEAASEGKLTAAATDAEKAAAAAAPAPPPAKIDIGMVAAIGLAVGGIAAALGVLFSAFLGLGIWMPLGVLALLLLISGPSMLIAWLKLRQRNIGPLLDANGWAVNARAKLNIPFGRSLTSLAELPPGSVVDTKDPFVEKRTPWRLYLFLLIIIGLGVAYLLGYLDPLLPPAIQRAQVFGVLKV